MIQRLCPVAGCGKALPNQHAAFCVDHYFQIEPTYSKLIMKISIRASRADDEDTRRHLTEQLDGYIRSTMRLKGWDHAA